MKEHIKSPVEAYVMLMEEFDIAEFTVDVSDKGFVVHGGKITSTIRCVLDDCTSYPRIEREDITDLYGLASMLQTNGIFGDTVRICGYDVVVESMWSIPPTAPEEDKLYITKMHTVAAFLVCNMIGLRLPDMVNDIVATWSIVLLKRRLDSTLSGFTITSPSGGGTVVATIDKDIYAYNVDFVPGMSAALAASELARYTDYLIPVRMFGSSITLMIVIPDTKHPDSDIFMQAVTRCADMLGLKFSKARTNSDDWFIGLDVDKDDLDPELVTMLMNSNWESGDVKATALELNVFDIDVLTLIVPTAIENADGRTPQEMCLTGDLRAIYNKQLDKSILNSVYSVLSTIPSSMRRKYPTDGTLAALQFLRKERK